MDDGDGRENITFKMIPCFFKLCRVYSNSLELISCGPHLSLERES